MGLATENCDIVVCICAHHLNKFRQMNLCQNFSSVYIWKPLCNSNKYEVFIAGAQVQFFCSFCPFCMFRFTVILHFFI